MKFSSSALVVIYASIASGQTYKLASTIPWSPQNATNIDQSAFYSGTYYLSDRTNSVVHVVNTTSDTQITTVGSFAGKTPNESTSGPNGLVVLPDRNELYVGDGDSTVKVVSLSNYSVVAKISTGGTYRADELAYSTSSQIAVVTNPDDDIPFVTVINATSRSIMGQVNFTSNATGLEQPAWNSASDKFYISVPSTTANPGGEIDEIDVTSFNISNVYSLKDCIPAGIVFGPNQHLFVGCSRAQIDTYNTAFSLVIDIGNGGKKIANITGLAGIDQVAYDGSVRHYYAAAYQNTNNGTTSGTPSPQLGVIDAKSNNLIQRIPTDNITAHSVAVDNSTNQVFVPLASYGIAVYNMSGPISATNSSYGGGDGNSSASGGGASSSGSGSSTSTSSPKSTGAASSLVLNPMVYTGVGLLAFFLML